MKTMLEEIRKGPWTEQEDIVMVNFVHLFGDRRWDFIAKVSGLKVAGENNRTGKSCRLRWVNYLHPGLKRGKMTPQEERLVLELHAKWGNRWSRIARKLPGRTDNEIKNYWRTHMRKKAQEKKRITSSSSSNGSSLSTTTVDSLLFSNGGKSFFHDTGGADVIDLVGKNSKETKGGYSSTKEVEEGELGYSMDDIWKDIDLSEEDIMKPVLDGYSEKDGCFSFPSMVSLSWENPLDSVWNIAEEESKMFLPSNQLLPCYEYGRAS